MEMLDIKSNLEISGNLRIPLYATTHSQFLFATEPFIRGIAYQVTCAAHHHSVLLKNKLAQLYLSLT